MLGKKKGRTKKGRNQSQREEITHIREEKALDNYKTNSKCCEKQENRSNEILPSLSHKLKFEGKETMGG